MNTTLFRIATLIPLALVLAACQPTAKPGLQPAPGSTGNPPAIPHYVAADDAGEQCLDCHREGDGGAPRTPHPQLVDCRQCHIDLQQGVRPFAPSY